MMVIDLFAKYGKSAFQLFGVIFLAGIFLTLSRNNITLDKQAETIKSLTIQLEERKVLIESIKDGVTEANEISKRFLDIQQREQEKTYESIREVRNALKNNSCANTKHPDVIRQRLQQ